MSSLRQAFFKGTLAYTLAQILIKLRSLITLPIFAAFLGVEGYGIFTQITLTVTFFAPLVSLRLEGAIVRFLAGEDRQDLFRSRFYTALAAISLLGAGASLLIYSSASFISQLIFGDPVYAHFALLIGLLLFISVVLSFLQGYFRVVRQIQKFAAVGFVETLVETIFIVLAIYYGYGVSGALWSSVGVKGVFSIGLFVYVIRKIGGISLSPKELVPLLEYSVPLLPNPAMRWAINYADRIFITQFLGLAAIGAYSASYSLASLINLLIMPVSIALYPFLVNLWEKEDFAEVKLYFTYINRYYLLLALPACVGLAIISQPLLSLLATDEFATGTLLVFFVALGFVFNGVFQINVYIFHLVRKTYYNTLILLVSVLLNVSLNWWLVPRIGLNGAALATTLSFLVMAVGTIIYGQQLLSYQTNWLQINKIIGATICMAICLVWIPIEGWVSLIGSILFGSSIYFIILYILQFFTQEELSFLFRYLKSSLAT